MAAFVVAFCHSNCPLPHVLEEEAALYRGPCKWSSLLPMAVFRGQKKPSPLPPSSLYLPPGPSLFLLSSFSSFSFSLSSSSSFSFPLSFLCFFFFFFFFYKLFICVWHWGKGHVSMWKPEDGFVESFLSCPPCGFWGWSSEGRPWRRVPLPASASPALSLSLPLFFFSHRCSRGPPSLVLSWVLPEATAA